MISPASHSIIEVIIERLLPSLEWILLVFPLLSVYVTQVHVKWWKLYQPSPLIRHLLISSIAVDISSIIVAFIAGDALGLWNPDLPDGSYGVLLAIALLTSMGVKVYRRINLRALDHPDVDLEHRAETQDQREDRQFGEERRALEAEHNLANGSEGTYAEGLEAGRIGEIKDQAEDREFGSRRRTLEDKHSADKEQ